MRNEKGQFIGGVTGPAHPSWKGDNLGYIRMHKWVNKVGGHPSLCELCNNIFEDRFMEWSNKDHKYRRDLEDWQRVCRKCHKAYDRQYFGITGGAFNRTLGRATRL